MKLKITLAVVLAAAVAGGIAGAVVGLALGNDASGATPATTTAEQPQTEPTVGLTPEDIYRDAAPAVVVITATQTQKVPATFFSPAQTERVGVLGSGFVIDAKGDIVTNDHVVQNGTDIRVGFSGGQTYPATVVGTDPSTDLAVLRVQAPASALHPLQWSDSGAVKPGDTVYAIGNPFGLDRTMTAGIVSATGRDIQAPNQLVIPKAIQTDAAINHGNSGGPLLDDGGRIVGVNDQIESGSVDGNVGVGFAIPSDTAKSVVEQLIATGHAEHAWLGVQVAATSRAVVIARVVAGGPAAKAGLERGDAITAIDGTSISATQQVADAIAARKPGDQLTLRFVRDGQTRSVTVTLANVPARS